MTGVGSTSSSKPDPVRAIADAVLYEGYVLWPYRRSALKNQRRFNFGGVHPPAHAESHPDDACVMRTEVMLVAAPDAAVHVDLRFLQVVQRDVARRTGDELVEVDELVVGGERYLTWEEAVERELTAPRLSCRELAHELEVGFRIAAGSEHEDLVRDDGAVVGALRRSWRELTGRLCLRASAAGPELWRLSVTVKNTTSFTGGSRERALQQTLCSTHMLLHAPAGRFVSCTDPPPELAALTNACANVGTWPVLVGERGDRRTVLSSPIILEDYPRVAPESPGDLFDGGEIDQLLILNILALTDAEKAEMAASDPRAAEILRRTEALTPEQLLALHGTVREIGLSR
jgi:hypothetical protein